MRALTKGLDLNITSNENRWHVLSDVRQLAQEAAQSILNAARLALVRRRRFNIVLAGGSTPQAAYQLLVNADTDWSRWQIYFGDERCLPLDHAERNSVMASQSWLKQVAIPATNVHVIPAELGPEQGAAAYSPLIGEVMPFDMVLLGLGEDGHIASLFPGHDHDANKPVHGVYGAPKPPAERVSLGFSALNNTQEVLVLVSGKSKQAAVRRWRDGETLPITRIHGQTVTNVYLDKLANGQT